MTWSSQVLKSAEDRDLTASLVPVLLSQMTSLNLSPCVCDCCPCAVLSASTSENLAVIFVLAFAVVVAAARSTLCFQVNNFSSLWVSVQTWFVAH